MEFKIFLFLIGILSVNGFSLRRRSVQNPYDLSRALDVLERERRRIENQEYLRELLENQDSLYPYEDDQGYVAYKEPYESPGRYTIADILDAYPGLSLSGLQKPLRSAKRSRSVHTHTSEPTFKELENIFSPSNSASKKRDTSLSIHNLPNLKEKESKIKITETKSAKIEDTDTDENKSSEKEAADNENKKQISESEMEKLLSEAEKVDKDEVVKEVENEKVISKDSEPVKEELKTVFSEEKDDNSEQNNQDSDKTIDNNNKATDDEKQDNARDEPGEGGEKIDSERFWKLNEFVNLASGNKKKRGAKRDFGENEETQKSMIELVSEVEALRDEVSRLKLVEFLEDKENDFLASALKDATLAQLQGTNQYLKGEYGDIERAIEVEELLQTVKSDENDDSANEDENQTDKIQELIEVPDVESKQEVMEDDDSNEGPDTLYPSLEDEKAEKRDDNKAVQIPSLEDDMGRWYDRPIRGHSLTRDEAERVLENLIDNYGQETDIGENVEEPIIAEVPDESESESILEDLNPSQQKVLQYELSTNEDGESEEYCPEVQDLSDNCVIADAVGLPIDQEARRLCNRHQTCYKCGSTLGFSMAECDNGFRGDIIELCGSNSKCVLNGAEFLSFIKGYHKFNFDYSRQCDASCIKDFIVGL